MARRSPSLAPTRDRRPALVGAGGSDICVLDLATGEITYLTDDAAGDQRPTWSPDGSVLAFLTFGEDGVSRVRSVRAAGDADRSS